MEWWKTFVRLEGIPAFELMTDNEVRLRLGKNWLEPLRLSDTLLSDERREALDDLEGRDWNPCDDRYGYSYYFEDQVRFCRNKGFL